MNLAMKKTYFRFIGILRSLLDSIRLFNWQDLEKRKVPWIQTLFFTPQEMIISAIPWWPYKATSFISTHLEKRRGSTVFEWGSGASTRWLSTRADTVTSIEHDKEWFELLSDLKDDNTFPKLVESTDTPSGSPTFPSFKRGYENKEFKDYVQAIKLYPQKYDLIVIDGRARMDCLVESLEHLKEGGLIYLDNSSRKRYSTAKDIVGEDFKAVEFFGLTPASPFPTFSTVFLHDPQNERD